MGMHFLNHAVTDKRMKIQKSQHNITNGINFINVLKFKSSQSMRLQEKDPKPALVTNSNIDA